MISVESKESMYCIAYLLNFTTVYSWTWFLLSTSCVIQKPSCFLLIQSENILLCLNSFITRTFTGSVWPALCLHSVNKDFCLSFILTSLQIYNRMKCSFCVIKKDINICKQVICGKKATAFRIMYFGCIS